MASARDIAAQMADMALRKSKKLNKSAGTRDELIKQFMPSAKVTAKAVSAMEKAISANEHTIESNKVLLAFLETASGMRKESELVPYMPDEWEMRRKADEIIKSHMPKLTHVNGHFNPEN